MEVSDDGISSASLDFAADGDLESFLVFSSLPGLDEVEEDFISDLLDDFCKEGSSFSFLSLLLSLEKVR